MEMKRDLRGKDLDARLKEELEKMLNDGYYLSPVTRSNLQRRLGKKKITKDRQEKN